MAAPGDQRGARPDELGVLIAAGVGEPERLLMLGTPAAGRVHVREWSTHNWAGAPDERDLAVGDALAIFERAYESRRRLSVALGRVRQWLGGITTS
jgi:hypothetical protein